MSREDVIRRIVERDIKQLGLSEDVVRVGLPKLHQDACEFFGTWNTALQYSGISGRRATKTRKKRRLSEPSQLGRALCLERQQVIDTICERHKAGQSLSSRVVQKEQSVLLHSARHYFRTWKEAVEVAMLEIQKQPRDD